MLRCSKKTICLWKWVSEGLLFERYCEMVKGVLLEIDGKL